MMDDLDFGHLVRGREEIVHKTLREKLAVLIQKRGWNPSGKMTFVNCCIYCVRIPYGWNARHLPATDTA